jgi:hypothetical protein
MFTAPPEIWAAGQMDCAKSRRMSLNVAGSNSWQVVRHQDDLRGLPQEVDSAALGACREMHQTRDVSSFQHTFGTLLNANGGNRKVVQELLRHASSKVTTDVYIQAVSPQKRTFREQKLRDYLAAKLHLQQSSKSHAANGKRPKATLTFAGSGRTGSTARGSKPPLCRRCGRGSCSRCVQ